jgi:hypothetical protein
MRPVLAPVRPWCEVQSRRGAPRRIPTDGFACPNQQCLYFGITDVHIHALVGDGRHGQAEHIQTFRCQACRTTFSARRHTPLYRLKTLSRAGSRWCGSRTGRRDGRFRRRTSRRATVRPPSPRGSLAPAGTLKSSMSDPSTTCTFRICSWTNYAPGCAAPNRFVFLWLAIDPLTRDSACASTRSPHATHGPSAHPQAPTELGPWLPPALYE